MELAKVQALDRRARGTRDHARRRSNINVNFTIDGPNPYGVEQKPCIDCGNCVTGCNVGAKNTLYMNYLPMARSAGRHDSTRRPRSNGWRKLAAGGWRIHGKHVNDDGSGKSFTLDAGEVVLSAGSLNSTEILLRSEMHGLSVSPALGTKFSGNGDFFGLAYNGDYETDVLGYPPARRAGGRAIRRRPGRTSSALVRYNARRARGQRITVEDFSFPSAYVEGAKAAFGADSRAGHRHRQRGRRSSARLARDLDPADAAARSRTAP